MAKQEYNAARDLILEKYNFWQALLKSWDAHEVMLIKQDPDQLALVLSVAMDKGWRVAKDLVQHPNLAGLRKPELEVLARRLNIRNRSTMTRVTIERIVNYRLKEMGKTLEEFRNGQEESCDDCESCIEGSESVEDRPERSDRATGDDDIQSGLSPSESDGSTSSG